MKKQTIKSMCVNNYCKKKTFFFRMSKPSIEVEWRPRRFVNESHVRQNIFWHTNYSDDLERGEIVPLNAKRDELSPYWWVQQSRWRSRKQLKLLDEQLELNLS